MVILNINEKTANPAKNLCTKNFKYAKLTPLIYEIVSE